MVDVNNSCAITNNSGKPIVVLDAYGSATNVAKNSSQQGYEQTLKILPLTAGGPVIAPGATGTVTLNDTRTDKNGKTVPNYLYQLLISEPDSLSPVLNLSEQVDMNTTPMSYPAVTVAATAATNATLALSLCQQLMAYPSSDFAKGFVTAMQNAQKATSVPAMMKVVEDFLNTTKGFKGLDFPSYIAASTFMSAFAWVWGLDDTGKAGRTYYLYSSADAGGGSSSSSSASSSSKPTTHGTIVFTRKAGASSPADPTDRNSGYAISYNPPSGSATTLSFGGGQVLNDLSADNPTIAVQGSYALKSQFSQNDADSVLWPILVGTVNGNKVIGVSQPPAADDWLSNLLPKSFDDLLNMFLKIMGLWMAVDFIKSKLTGKKDKLEDDKTNQNEGRDPSPEQVDEANSDSESIGDEALQNNRGRLRRDAPNDDDASVPDEDDLFASLDEAREQLAQVLNEINGDNYQGQIDLYDENLKALAEIEVNDDIEDAMSSLIDAKGNLAEAVRTGDFSSIKDSLGSVKTSVQSAVEEMDLPEQLADKIASDQRIVDDYQKASDQLEDDASDASDGTDPFEDDFEFVE